MEILRWVFLAGVEHRTTWFLSATTVGICVVVLVAALCAKSVVSRREVKGSNPGSRWSAVRSKVTNIVRKAGFRRSLKDDEGEVSFLCDAEEGGRVSAAAAAATPPLWQKKIIMGERCALPTFSGLILYDEKGNTLPLAARQKTDFR